MTDDQMYAAIFSYIEHLFEIIKPTQVFYMAIDGVAPRAKMNQQRARRFRTAIEAEENMKKAIKNGDVIPKDDPFDSNGITPGTEFMAKLTDNLKYFIHKKISEDSNWAQVQIILLGHEVPGEGEHKIMDYIRTMKAQDGYDANLRHCIYGLDADLIMLGLLSHDPHFALLREEVTFGPSRGLSTGDLNDQKFFLLHLSLLREYLALEFLDLEDILTFDYSFERVLDDFILIMYVIGNDFLPNLPDLFINKGAFPLLIATFKQVLKESDGYLNEGGKINLKRLSIWLQFLSEFELENFEKQDVDVEWFNNKLDDISIGGEKKRKRIGKLLILKDQKKLIGSFKPWLLSLISKPVNELVELDASGNLNGFPLDYSETEKYLEFLKEFALQAGLLIVHSNSQKTYEIRLDLDGLSPYETPEEFEDRVQDVRKLLKKYESANLFDTDELMKDSRDLYDQKFVNWKDKYYTEKLHFSINDKEELVKLTKHYVEGLQWVLYYYYKGVPSWNWYYKYHYAPRISDISAGLDVLLAENKDIEFDLSQPFKPFEQLMAVLPARSRKLMPAIYRPLMTEEHSPIISFYPDEVDIDQNGKTASWEAVVLLDFVDEQKLLSVLRPVEAKLSPLETKRNSLGTPIIFIYNPQTDYVYPLPLPGFFHDLEHDHCHEKVYALPKADKVLVGLAPGARIGKNMSAGFPTLSSIPFISELMNNEVKVFQQPSRSESLILTLENIWLDLTVAQFSQQFVNRLVYSKWPFLRECKVVKVIDFESKYESVKTATNRKVVSSGLSYDDVSEFKTLKRQLVDQYNKTKGIKLGSVDVLVYVQPVNGLIRNQKGAYVKTYSKNIEIYPIQLIVKEVNNKDHRYAGRPPLPIQDEFPVDSQVVFLGDMGYGSPAKIVGYDDMKEKLSIKISKIQQVAEPTIGKQRLRVESKEIRYYPSYEISKQLKLNPLLFSRLTTAFFIEGPTNQRVNIGLELKFDARRQKVLGYTRRFPNSKFWEFSPLAVNLVNEYMKEFPNLFANLRRIDPKETPRASDITSGPDELKAIRAWLKAKRADFITVSLESESLTKFSYEAIELFMEHYIQQPIPLENKDIKGVPKDAVLNPQELYQLLSSQKFDLGDRIVYIQDYGKLPVLSKGTVVGITAIGNKISLNVIFDNVLLNGNTMNGKLRTTRGLTIDSSLVLNLSNKQFVFHSKASQGRKKLTDEEREAYTKVFAQKKSEEAEKKAKREKAVNVKKSNELLSLLKGEKKPQKGKKEEEDADVAEAPRRGDINKIYGQIYENVMNPHHESAPQNGSGFSSGFPGPGGPGGPFIPGFGYPGAFPPGHGFPGQYGIPVVPGIPLPPQFFQQQQQGAPQVPVQQFQQLQVQEEKSTKKGASRNDTSGNGRSNTRGRGDGRRGGRGRGGRGKGTDVKEKASE